MWLLRELGREESWDEGLGLSGKLTESRGRLGKSSGSGEGNISGGGGRSRKDRSISASSSVC